MPVAIVLFLLAVVGLTLAAFTLRERRHTSLWDPLGFAAGPDDPDSLRWLDC